MRQIKIIVEKHPDGYVAYPIGHKGVVVDQGDTYEEALSDVKSAIIFHIKSFGPVVLDVDPPSLEAVMAETEQGRGVLGVIDGLSTQGIESEEDIKERKDFLRKIGYKIGP